jgi:3-oxoadipate enol-lactonase
MQRLNVGAAALEYERHGSGEPILLIHGVLVGDLLRPLANEEGLAGRYELIVYHRRGVAGSDAVRPPFTIGDQAADAPALLRELGVERVHVVGHSYGAAIALQLAVDAPESVHTLTLLEAPSVAVPSVQQIVEAMGPIGGRFASGEREGATDDFLAAMGGAGYREPLDRLLPGAFEQAVADSDALFTVEFPALAEWGLSQADATRIDAPVCGSSPTTRFHGSSRAMRCSRSGYRPVSARRSPARVISLRSRTRSGWPIPWRRSWHVIR